MQFQKMAINMIKYKALEESFVEHQEEIYAYQKLCLYQSLFRTISHASKGKEAKMLEHWNPYL